MGLRVALAAASGARGGTRRGQWGSGWHWPRPVGLRVALAIPVGLGVALAIPVGLGVALAIPVGIGVALAIPVGLGVALAIPVGLGVALAIPVGLGVALAIPVGLGVALAMPVGLGVAPAMPVGLGVAPAMPVALGWHWLCQCPLGGTGYASGAARGMALGPHAHLVDGGLPQHHSEDDHDGSSHTSRPRCEARRGTWSNAAASSPRRGLWSKLSKLTICSALSRSLESNSSIFAVSR